MSNNEKNDSAGGEFTRLFQGLEGSEPKPAPPKPVPLSSIPNEKPGATPAVPKPLPPDSSQSPVAPEPSVTRPMTRLFSAKAQPQRPERASTPSPFEVNPRPGEFTRLFKPGEPESQPPVTRASESPAQPGEFTRMFSVPPATRSDFPKPTPEPPTAPPKPRESFTEFFESARVPLREKGVDGKELETKPAPAANKEGDFTVLFGRAKTPPQTPSAELAPPPGPATPDPVKDRAALFETTLYSDEFAKVIGGSRPRPSAAAQPLAANPAPAPQPTAESAKTTPPLWILAAVVAVVLVLAFVAIYVFVIRG